MERRGQQEGLKAGFETLDDGRLNMQRETVQYLGRPEKKHSHCNAPNDNLGWKAAACQMTSRRTVGI